jgi:Ni/Co efflux regulator RcnB
MRKMLASILLATVVIPAAAQAQDRDHNRGQGHEERQGGGDHGRPGDMRHDAGRQDGQRHDGERRDEGRSDGGRGDGRWNGGRQDLGQRHDRPGFDGRGGYDRRGGFGGPDGRRGDYHADEWRGWRDSHPGDYRRGGWRAPFGYRNFGIGAIAPRGYWDSRYYVNDWGRYHLPRPGYGYYRYVRHYDDVLLINIRNGRVIRVYRGFYR